MYVNRAVELNSDNMHRFQCFIVFDPASSRINETDVLVRGQDILEMYEKVASEIETNQSIQAMTLRNRLSKIGQMLDLLVTCDNLIITKFFDRIWRRYSYVSNISELFLDYPTFIKYFPEFEKDKEALLAQRIDGSEDDEDGDGGSDNGSLSEE
jgi:hypothetical protein